MFRCVAVAKIDVLEEHIASVIKETRIRELGTTLAVTNNRSKPPIRVTLMMGTIRSSKTSILKRATRRNIPEDDILFAPTILGRNVKRNYICRYSCKERRISLLLKIRVKPVD
jgi:hypothetical protein